MRWLRGSRTGLVICAAVLTMVAGACGLFGPDEDDERRTSDSIRAQSERAELDRLNDRMMNLGGEFETETPTTVGEEPGDAVTLPPTRDWSSGVPSPTTMPGNTSVDGIYDGLPGLVRCDIEPYPLYTFTLAGGTVTIEAGGQIQATGSAAPDGSFTIEAGDGLFTVTGSPVFEGALTVDFTSNIHEDEYRCGFQVHAFDDGGILG